ncbi:hypothetical protein EST92_16425 [Streptomyces sp. TM32]|uniref:DUF6801 domain-containing protein n=1 Tax=Streptomyces sp. TM32 TaxID=1652669 RepID=UPI00101028CC|nr:DUF6801 domain-containing protein [Streptomyces sp. TM32]RXS81144.1 hypothetical protein EST92_16425 [Streptomyces sp. TM32]
MIIRSGRQRMRIILAVTTASAMASGWVGTIGAGTAGAQPSPAFGYTCSSPLIGDQSFTAEIHSDIPHSVAVGAPIKPIAVNAVATVGASFTQLLNRAGMKTLGGTVDARAHVAAPQDEFDVTVPFHMATTSVPASGPFNVTATAGATTRTFSHPGHGTVTAGNITLHLLAKNAAGTITLAGDAPCTLNTGQSNVVTSFDITKPGSAPSAPPSPSTGPGAATTPRPTTGSGAATTPRPTTGSVGAAVPKPTMSESTGPAKDSATTPSNPSPRASSPTPVKNSPRPTPRSTKPTIVPKPSAAGQDTGNLILLAVGALVACAAAFLLGTRLKNHRRAGDDGGDQRYISPKPDWPTEGVKATRGDVSCHRKVSIAAAPQHRGCDGRTTSHDSTGRKVADDRNRLMARHIPRRAGHQGVSARDSGGADLDSQLAGLLQGEDVDVVADEKPSTEYVRQA